MAFAASWPSSVVDDVIAYTRRHDEPQETRARSHRERYWTMLPVWLFHQPGFAAARRRGTAFLDDVLWAQYCVFLAVRIHDDLFDGQADRSALLYVADGLLVEGRRRFAIHLHQRQFWARFDELIDTSVRSILAVDVRQQRPGAFGDDALALYAGVSSIFKLGAAAFCVKCRRLRDFHQLSAFADALAIANQIVDDVMDVHEDIDRGRFNYVANRMGLSVESRDGERRARIAEAVFVEDAVGGLAARVDEQLHIALHAARRLGIREAVRYVERMQRNLRLFRAELHRRRAGALLGPLLRAS